MPHRLCGMRMLNAGLFKRENGIAGNHDQSGFAVGYSKTAACREGKAMLLNNAVDRFIGFQPAGKCYGG